MALVSSELSDEGDGEDIGSFFASLAPARKLRLAGSGGDEPLPLSGAKRRRDDEAAAVPAPLAAPAAVEVSAAPASSRADAAAACTSADAGVAARAATEPPQEASRPPDAELFLDLSESSQAATAPSSSTAAAASFSGAQAGLAAATPLLAGSGGASAAASSTSEPSLYAAASAAVTACGGAGAGVSAAADGPAGGGGGGGGGSLDATALERCAAVQRISDELAEPNVVALGIALTLLPGGALEGLRLLARVHEVEAAGGMLIADKSRRRTPGGVFFALLRDCLSAADYKAVLKPQAAKDNSQRNAAKRRRKEGGS